MKMILVIGFYVLAYLTQGSEPHIDELGRERTGRPLTRYERRENSKYRIAVKTRKQTVNARLSQQLDKVIAEAANVLQPVVVLSHFGNVHAANDSHGKCNHQRLQSMFFSCIQNT